MNIHYRRDESWMGRHLRDYKPRTNANTIIHTLRGARPAVIPSAIAIAREEFADVSFYQAVIDWAKMRLKARKVIIRAGQNLWIDIKFKVNYFNSKINGFLRGIYWFFDGRVSPGAQAALLVALIRDDPPELGIWIDWERNYGGAHEGLKNVVAMMQEIERLLPGVQVGLYTGYYFFIENSNPITNFFQYAYLATRKLWLAFYAELAKVLIPKIWTQMTYWQKGTPAVGKDWGVETIEIDMNEDMEGGEPEPQPEPGGAMKGIVKTGYTLKIRDGAGNDTGKTLKAGDVVYGPVINSRIYFFRVYRANGTIEEQAGNAAVRDATTEWMTLTDEAEPIEPAPIPGPELKPIKVTFESEQYETLIVELKPKA